MSYVGQYVDQFASQRPQALALLCDEHRYTWAELARAVSQVAYGVDAFGQHGDKIALDFQRADLFLIAFMGVIRTGRIAVVLDSKWEQRRKTDAERRVGCVMRLGDADVLEFLEAQVTGRSGETVTAHGEDPFYIGFTSGSTGQPKGYQRGHASWLKGFSLSKDVMGLGAWDRVAVPGPMSHSLHLYGAVQALDMGAAVLTVSQFQARRFVKDMEAFGASAVYVTPTQLHYLVAAGKSKVELDELQRVLISGAKWTGQGLSHLAGVAPNVQVIEFYGASELSFVSVKRPVDEAPSTSVGVPIPDIKLEIRNQVGEPVGVGETGCIWVASSHAFDGYACGSDDSFRRDGAFVTIGDHGWLDASGFLYVAGRENRMLVSAGVNIYPEEAERYLEARRDVAHAAILPSVDEVRGTVAVALVKAKPHQELEVMGLLKDLRKQVGSSKAPRRVVIVERDWPLTASGKTDFGRLAQLYEQELA
ncbi:putative acyl--CoA ligase YhfT [Pseudovibrio axinellae]|uniref:Putative acyl--CoA ligase YhfT n=1 Tax=Pseudovibrio axinellae TaxID=989403 RepID=A0A166A3H9_9HYPH|nr:AMP-binding protein [Pseudovibrio axinellae]KZL20589.1 putative acyl--CoA ligase YhfT [Pseudovibrio axinellae]SER28486.1 long-chain acyl-CoA synthetase [Pseudovibrio axinellae]